MGPTYNFLLALSRRNVLLSQFYKTYSMIIVLRARA